MKFLTLSAVALALTLAGGSASAAHCPKDMKKIDDALAMSPKLDEKQMQTVKELRATGEELHNAKKHRSSEAVLAAAMKILGVE